LNGLSGVFVFFVIARLTPEDEVTLPILPEIGASERAPGKIDKRWPVELSPTSGQKRNIDHVH
jgi:hypothetical protein